MDINRTGHERQERVGQDMKGQFKGQDTEHFIWISKEHVRFIGKGQDRTR